MQIEPPGHDPPEWLRYALEETLSGAAFASWIPAGSFAASALTRVPRYPRSIGDAESRTVSIDAARNERRSAQLAVATTAPLDDLRAEVSDFDGDDGAMLSSDVVETRYVGYVPVEVSHPARGDFPRVDEIAGRGVSGDRAPDVVGDPLLEADSVDVPAHRAQGIWFTFAIPADATAGSYEGTISIDVDGRDPTTYDVELTVRDVVLPESADAKFHLDLWLHPDSIAAEHGVEPWGDRHWSLLEAYFDDLAAAGQGPVAAVVLHEPWHREWLGGATRPQTATGFSSLVEWHFDGTWSFDFERFDRFVETALDHGLGPTISAYSMLTFRSPQRLSYYDGDGSFRVEELQAGDDRWREAWAAFLESFGEHLDERGWRERTYLAFDERPREEMEAALSVIEDTEPGFLDRIRVAGSHDVASFTHDLSVHYHEFPVDDEMVDERRDAGKLTTLYFAHPVTHPRTFSYSPAVETRIQPWIAAENDLDGLLRWSYNSWPHDVFENPVFRYPQGSEYFVYPGEDGPMSSIRWELLREGIGEYELVRMARERSDEDVAELLTIATRNRDGREKDLEDITTARRRLFDVLE